VYQRNGNPTLGRINQVVKRLGNEGNLPNLHQMEQDGLVVYHGKDGTYHLTEKGRLLISKEKQQ